MSPTRGLEMVSDVGSASGSTPQPPGDTNLNSDYPKFRYVCYSIFSPYEKAQFFMFHENSNLLITWQYFGGTGGFLNVQQPALSRHMYYQLKFVLRQMLFS